jgi:nitroreductase
MDALEAIISRRSTRKYKPEPVPKELIDELLNAAMNAPSAGNEQPWYFIVIQDHKILDEIPKFHPYSSCLKEAPQAIVVCADLKLLKHPEPWWVLDCSAATENILIAAYAKGLGARWVGVYPMDDRVKCMKELLGLPQEIIPVSIVAIGYPVEKTPFESRYQPSRILYNHW